MESWNPGYAIWNTEYGIRNTERSSKRQLTSCILDLWVGKLTNPLNLMIIQVVVSLVIHCDRIGLVERHMTVRPYADVDFNEEEEGDNKVSVSLTP